MTIDLTSATRRMIDLSTAHITKTDMDILNRGFDDAPRTVCHAYGAIIFGCPDCIKEDVATLRERGHSDELIAIYLAAFKGHDRGDVILINFDQDAIYTEGLPQFDW